MEKYYSTHEVAKVCQVSRGSVIRWINEGKLPAAATPGGHSRVTARDLKEFLKSLRMEIPKELTSLSGSDSALSVLIVADEPSVRKFLKIIFASEFPELLIAEAADGFEAGLLARQLKPALIILDRVLPGIDGFKV